MGSQNHHCLQHLDVQLLKSQAMIVSQLISSQLRSLKSLALAFQPKSQITDKELNLIGDWPMKGKFDVIFCRNVVIYFDDPTQERVWSRFIPLMNPGATLYIGHSERVAGPAASQLQTAGLTTYRLGGV